MQEERFLPALQSALSCLPPLCYQQLQLYVGGKAYLMHKQKLLLAVLSALPLCFPVSVLGEAVHGWDAVETELRAAAGHPALELERVRVATQVGVAPQIKTHA
jgi:hypothetical protein